MIEIESASFDWFNLNNIYNNNQKNKIKLMKKQTKNIHSSSMFCAPYILNDIELRVQSKHLICVIGDSGAGKSSLLNLILGEMSKIYGYVGIRGNISFCSQKSWLFNGTIRENILLNFGS